MEYRYSHDLREFVHRFILDRRHRQKPELTCKVIPRTDIIDRPALNYESLACGNLVVLPLNEELLAQVRDSGMLDVFFSPSVDDIEVELDAETKAVISGLGIDNESLFDALYRDGVLIDERYVEYVMPAEYFEAARVIRFSGGSIPTNLPANFIPIKVGYHVGSWTPGDCPHRFVTFEKDAAPVPLPEITGIGTGYQLW